MGGEPTAHELHPAEHRAYRELYASARQLVNRWGRLSSALAETPYEQPLVRGRALAEGLLESLPNLTEPYGLHGGVMAQGVGARIAGLRSAATDRSVDTGLVLRMAVLDIEHVRTLLGQLTALARSRGDERAAAFCADWESRFSAEVDSTRLAAISMGEDPERAAAPLDDSLIGRAAHGAGWVLGSVGEAVDRVAGSRGGSREDQS
jgi:hypothetical protein